MGIIQIKGKLCEELHYLDIKISFQFLKNKKIFFYDPAIPRLGMYPKKILIEKDTCTPVFIV